MQNLHPAMLTEIAHVRIDEAVRSASRTAPRRTREGRRARDRRWGRHRFRPEVG